MRIAIVDYGMGNIKSISSSLNYIGVKDVILSSDYAILKSADKLILPGVGSFGQAMKKIREKKIDEYLTDLVIQNGKPLLGICLGMQLMGESSNEDGENLGLGFINGIVRKFEVDDVKIPHVGFNQVKVNQDSLLYSGIGGAPDFYFTHSYRMTATAEITPSFCEYGEVFVASFEKNNIAGVQFHPELSQHNGLNLLKNFIDKF